MKADEKHYIVSGEVVWDGITQPEEGASGKLKHTVKIAIHPSSPEVAELQAAAQDELNAGEFKGALPNGGQMPVNFATEQEYLGQLTGYAIVNFGTYNGAPQVYDQNGRRLDAMQLGAAIYPGAKIKVLCHTYTYNNKSKGVAFGLDGIRIDVPNAPRKSYGTGGIDAGKFFGAASSAPAPQAAPAPAPAPAAAPPPPPHNPLPKTYTVNGASYTREQLLGYGWTAEQIDAL